MNLVTPKAAAKRELLYYKQASEAVIDGITKISRECSFMLDFCGQDNIQIFQTFQSLFSAQA